MRIKETMIVILAVLGTAGVLSSCSQTEQNPEAAVPNSASTSASPSTNQAASSTSSAQSEAATGVHEGTVSGVISDSMCGSDHTKMCELGKDAQACSQKCVESGAKYVLVDHDGEVYQLSDQKRVKEFAGKSVAVSGHIDHSTKAIHLHSITGQ